MGQVLGNLLCGRDFACVPRAFRLRASSTSRLHISSHSEHHSTIPSESENQVLLQSRSTNSSHRVIPFIKPSSQEILISQPSRYASLAEHLEYISVPKASSPSTVSRTRHTCRTSSWARRRFESAFVDNTPLYIHIVYSHTSALSSVYIQEHKDDVDHG